MQTISSNFNRFYHALLNEVFKKLRQVSFREWKDTNTGGCLIFYRDEVDTKELNSYMELD